jgi:D-lactate dehydrogenase (cytochrome)
VVPQGGNTGLVGGSVPVFDEIIINMSNMNKVLFFDEIQRVVAVEAGEILLELEKCLLSHRASPPFDIGSRGLCQIGGLIATNACGIRFIKTNKVQASLVGLKAVLPNGEIFDAMTVLRKDQTGYDIKQNFVGSEGTLGIITEASILCGPLPVRRVTALISVETFEEVTILVSKAKVMLGNILSILEFMDSETISLTTGGARNCDLFVEAPYSFCVIMEVEVYSSNDSNS